MSHLMKATRWLMSTEATGRVIEATATSHKRAFGCASVMRTSGHLRRSRWAASTP